VCISHASAEGFARFMHEAVVRYKSIIMKLSYFPLLVLALLSGCKLANHVRSDLSHTIEEVYNPSILGFQFLTIEIKRDKGVLG
jgi:hypothetical protein